jgi:ribonucleoside-diphosphate reductase alpha chain
VLPATRFTDPAAVETWDAWFRWRQDGSLRDVTIDDTWWRVADAVTLKDEQAGLWKHRYVDAFSRWRLLPDERLLRAAGTGVRFAVDGPPSALLNVAAFLNSHFGGGVARFDEVAFTNTAALAVRLLDDALLSHPDISSGDGLRIGVVGFADALAGLGLPYGSLLARELAREIARALAQGCLCGAADLAEERGPSPCGSRASVARYETRGMPQGLIERVECHGLRHAVLTAIEPHPLLARLANGVADGFDPAAADGPMAAEARRELLRSIQPWIDEPIQLQPAGLPEPATITG